MSYPPVGYVVIRLLKPDYKHSIYTVFFHNYDKALEYCKEKNDDPKWKEWYFEPNEVDILD